MEYHVESYEEIRQILEEELGCIVDGETVTDVITEGYAEPGYSDDGVIILGNWNPKRFPKEGDPPLTTEENLGPRLAEKLEEVGADLQWLDEWSTCSDCRKAFRIVANSYSWMPAYVITGDDYLCVPCAKDYATEILDEEFVNNSHNAVTWLSPSEMEELGWEFWNQDHLFENGWHEGQTDDPEEILTSILEDDPEAKVVFLLDENSQFYIRFSAWTKSTGYTQ